MKNPTEDQRIDALARRFATQICCDIDTDDMPTVIAKNKVADENVCHTHDYIDANMSMWCALEDLGYVKADDNGEFLNSDDGCDLFNAAWNKAKDANFWYEDRPGSRATA
jgi:hypothetical protein